MNIVLMNIDGEPNLLVNSKRFKLISGFQLHKALEELRSLNTGLAIEFENFNQFNLLVNQLNKMTYL